MNRPVDYRSDYYSFGVTLHEMLCGRVPFAPSSPVDLVHAHLARAPRPLSELRPDLPAPVSALVSRLLARNAEDRYQSSVGLLDDLDRCLAMLERDGAIGAFEIAATDLRERVTVPRKVYGRGEELGVLREALAGHRDRLRVWSTSCPANFEAMRCLVEAGHAVEGGDLQAAMASFDASLDAAAQAKLPHIEGLAAERATRLYLDLGRTRIAACYLTSALGAYERWGAHGKVEALTAAHADLLAMAARTRRRAAAAEDVDLASVLRSARIVSSEMDLDRLLRRGMAVVIANAGAQTGALVLLDGPRRRVVASADADHGDAAGLAEDLVDYCLRTGDVLVLDDPHEDEVFAEDPHIAAVRPRSVMVMPLRDKGNVVGALYLENRLSAGAFPSSTRPVLEALCAQIVVSMVNAQTYQDMERLVDERTALLAEAKETAERASDAKSFFLASMSHELRAPLNTILGYSELVKEELADEDNHQHAPDLDRIHFAGSHLLSLIDEVLDLSKIEAGRLQLDPVEVDLAEPLQEIVSSVMPMVKEKGNQLESDISADLGTLTVDPLRLRQILYNLLSNASKFTDRGVINLRVRRASAGISFEVEDMGVGMSPAELERVFEPFVQAGQSTNKRYGGTGLGLYICQRLCHLMGGDIEATSEPGVGSRFRLTLPAGRSRPG